MKIEIEKNVSEEKGFNGKKFMEAVLKMEIGDSFLLDKKYQTRVATYSRYAGVKLKTKAVSDDSIRVFKVGE